MLDRLLDGDVAEHPTPAVNALADLLAAAAAPASGRELAGQAAAVAAFVRERDAGGHRHSAARRRSMLATLLGTKLAAAAATGAVGFGGLAAAAYAGALPEPIQDFAHQTVGAPAASTDHTDSGQGPAHKNGNAGEQATAGQSGQPVGPDATGPSKYGLCTAFAEEQAENGRVDTKSVAFQALANAAGGADNIDEFCADVNPPSQGTDPASVSSSDAASDHASSPPTDAPTGTPATPQHPTGKPTQLPTP
jgi:hypothetical protein